MKKFATYPKIKGLYSHYLGGEYIVKSLAKHSTTGEILVIYKSITFGDTYARPLSEWFDVVEKHPDGNAKTIRFQEHV